MSALGPHDNPVNISQLDPRNLVVLARDFLVIQGHQDIRVTDGPGDGGRDIYSIDPYGRPHLTQCKYHAKSSKSCTSAELSELPMALVKFGYRSGLFITNARISPQAKREYLEDYPELSLDFFDGQVLAGMVLASDILTRLWLQGDQPKRSEAVTTLPVLVRRHRDDSPIVADISYPQTVLLRARLYLEEHFPKDRFDVRAALIDERYFDPYRSPARKCVEEGITSSISALEISCYSERSLDEVPRLQRFVGQALCLALRDYEVSFTAVVGRPIVRLLSSDRLDSGFELNMPPLAVLHTARCCALQDDWLNIHEDPSWTVTTDARATEGPYIRMYSSKCDAALSISIECEQASFHQRMSDELRRLRMEKWQTSVHCLSIQNAEWISGVPPPDECRALSWGNLQLNGWLHQSLVGYPIAIPSLRNAQCGAPFAVPDENQEAARLDAIRQAIAADPTLEFIDPQRAYHLLAALGNDVFPGERTKRFHTGDIAWYPRNIPIPLLPAALEVELVVAWNEPDKSDQIVSVVAEYEGFADPGFIRIAGIQRVEGIVVLTACLLRAVQPIAPMKEQLNVALLIAENLLEFVDQRVGYPKRCTREWWLKRYRVALGTSPEESGKQYEWKGTDLPPEDFFWPVVIPRE